MNVEDTTASPDASQDEPEGMYSGFVGANAGYFAQTFAPLNEIFSNDGAMKIVSDEEDYVVVVAVRLLEGEGEDEEGEVDVDCAILEANQKHLSSCLVALD